MTFLDRLRYFFSKPKRPDNTGVLLGNQPTDYFVGANSPIPYQSRLPDGNWTPYAFDQEQQWCFKNGQYVDTMSCVTQSIINSIEAQEFFLTGKQVNYSKRWIAKLSGTTAQGNYQYKVADTIRAYGLVLEQDYPTPDSYTWAEYYADIPNLDQLKAKGQDWLKKWNFQYEFLQVTDPNLDYHLKHAPIQVVIPGHAICGIYSPDQNMTILDSYSPWIKKYSSAGLLSAMKGILTPKTIVSRRMKFRNHPEVWHILPDDSMERLKYFDDNIPLVFPDYSVDVSQIYTVPADKPTWS